MRLLLCGRARGNQKMARPVGDSWKPRAFLRRYSRLLYCDKLAHRESGLVVVLGENCVHSEVTSANRGGFSVPKGFVLGHFYFVESINHGVLNGFGPAIRPFDFNSLNPVDCSKAKMNGI